jgi:hypothetical protein
MYSRTFPHCNSGYMLYLVLSARSAYCNLLAFTTVIVCVCKRVRDGEEGLQALQLPFIGYLCLCKIQVKTFIKLAKCKVKSVPLCDCMQWYGMLHLYWWWHNRCMVGGGGSTTVIYRNNVPSGPWLSSAMHTFVAFFFSMFFVIFIDYISKISPIFSRIFSFILNMIYGNLVGSWHNVTPNAQLVKLSFFVFYFFELIFHGSLWKSLLFKEKTVMNKNNSFLQEFMANVTSVLLYWSSETQ